MPLVKFKTKSKVSPVGLIDINAKVLINEISFEFAEENNLNVNDLRSYVMLLR